MEQNVANSVVQIFFFQDLPSVSGLGLVNTGGSSVVAAVKNNAIHG